MCMSFIEQTILDPQKKKHIDNLFILHSSQPHEFHDIHTPYIHIHIYIDSIYIML